MKKRDLLMLEDLSAGEIKQILKRAAVLKKGRRRGRVAGSLKGKSLGMVFEKPSTRTKVSFDVAMHELGGHSISLDSVSSQLGRGETYRDTGRVLSRYVHGIVIRTSSQGNVQELAEGASVPVINGLSDLYHPCQVLTDLFTIQEVKRSYLNLNITYIGDGNNMANSWILAAKILGFSLKVATPPGFGPAAAVLKKIDRIAARHIVITRDPVEAVRSADVVNTDTWFSMGQQVSAEKRAAFAPYQVNTDLMRQAKRDAVVLHCLPAHRGEEITNEVMDGPQSRIWDQAENRLHVQKAILEVFLK